MDPPRSRTLRTLLAGAALLALACGGESGVRGPAVGAGGLEVWDPVVTAPIAGGAGALYLRLENPTGRQATLVGISVPGATASLHRTEERDGRSVMRPVAGIPLEAGATLRLRPGGYHGMIRWADGAPAPGDTVAVTLGFEDGPELAVAAAVLAHPDALERHPPGPGRAPERP